MGRAGRRGGGERYHQVEEGEGRGGGEEVNLTSGLMRGGGRGGAEEGKKGD